MAAFNYFDCFIADLANGVHDLANDTLKVALSTAAPVGTEETLSELSEDLISLANLDTATIVTTSSEQTDGDYKLVVEDLVMTATGAVPSFRYVVVYNDSSTSDSLVCWFDYGEARTMSEDETLTLDFNQDDGLFYINKVVA
jgi:hypothetical protein